MTAVVYRDATIFDGTGAAPSAGMSLVVDGDRIVDVVETARLVVPEGAEVVDLAGRFVIPGLVDAHQHLATPPDRVKAEAWLRQMVYGGVTAIRDMADDLRQVGDLARACLVGEIPGPDIHYAALMAGPGFFDDPRTWQVSQGETPGQVPWMQAITDETDLVIATALARGTHASAIKVYADLSADLVAAIVTEAHRQGIPVWAHLSVFPALPLDVVGAGVDVVSHVSLLRLADPGRRGRDVQDEGTDRPRERGPGRPPHRRRARGDGRAGHDPRRHREHVGEPRGPRRGRRRAVTRAQGNAVLAAELTARAFAAGVPICPGSDNEAQPDAPFPTLHDELYFLHERCGMPAADVLRAATQVGARSAGAEDRMGTLEAGKLASFVVLDEDPIADLATSPASGARSSAAPATPAPTSPRRSDEHARPDDRERARDPRQPERRAVARGSRPAQPQQRPAQHRRPDPDRRPRLRAHRGQHHPRLHDGRDGALRPHPRGDRGLGPAPGRAPRRPDEGPDGRRHRPGSGGRQGRRHLRLPERRRRRRRRRPGRGVRSGSASASSS